MNISLNWLKSHIENFPDKIDPKELGLRLTMSTVEVDKVLQRGQWLNDVVVGELLSIEKHPNADKLSIAQVDVGEDKPRQIVFGQMVQMEPGFKVPVALAPTILPGNKKIEKAKLRGVESQGMLCLDQELGLLEDGVSIKFFPKETKNGTPIVKILGLDDVIYEIDNKSLTNRPDLWGHFGMAREVAALYDLKLKEYTVEKIREGKEIDLQVKVKDTKLCPRYLGVAVKGIKVGPSPEWLVSRLQAIGQKSINNIVDITNYIMFDLGQPLHAFDAAKIKDHEIHIRPAKKGEKLVTLDDIERELETTDLVIADGERAVALAGVMGNANSEIIDSTDTVIIESANFDATTIRKTASRLGLRTEAVARFEKSLDPNMAEVAIRKAVDMILEMIPGAEVASALIDEKKFKLFEEKIKLSWGFIEKRIGNKIPAEKVVEILTGLGFIVKESKSGIIVEVPTWRATKDISIKEDIIEEITRVYGYDNIVPAMPVSVLNLPEENKLRMLERKTKDVFSLGLHANEVANYSFADSDFLKKINQLTDDHIELENPWAENRNILRRSLVPGLIVNALDNLRYYTEINVYEVGKIFIRENDGEPVRFESKEVLPLQESLVAGVIASSSEDAELFFRAKGQAEEFFHNLGLEITFSDFNETFVWCHPKQSLEIFVDGEAVGYITNLHPAVATDLGFGGKMCIWQINLNRLLKYYPQVVKFEALPRFPGVELDISVILDAKVMWKDVLSLVKVISPELIQKVVLLDVYKNDKIKEDKKSMTFRVIYQSADRTLQGDEVNKLQARVIEQLEKALKAEIRK